MLQNLLINLYRFAVRIFLNQALDIRNQLLSYQSVIRYQCLINKNCCRVFLLLIKYTRQTLACFVIAIIPIQHLLILCCCIIQHKPFHHQLSQMQPQWNVVWRKRQSLYQLFYPLVHILSFNSKS